MPLNLIEPIRDQKINPQVMLRTETDAYTLLHYNNGERGLIACPLNAQTEMPNMDIDQWYEPECAVDEDEAFFDTIFKALELLHSMHVK